MASLVNVERVLSDRNMQAELLNSVGSMYQKASQRSFQEQRWGSESWPARYPSQREPKVNVAGCIKDFNAGRRKPYARRFQDRPALKDTGDLRRSIAYRVVVSEGGVPYVEIYSPLDYALTQLEGGESTMHITPAARDAAREWLGTPEGMPYRSKLWRVFSKRDGLYVVKVNARKFLGTTPALERKTARMIVAAAESGRVGVDDAAA